MAARFIAFTELKKMGTNALIPLSKLMDDANPRIKARATWLAGKIFPDPNKFLAAAIKDENPNLRIVALRLARQDDRVNTLEVVSKLVNDSSPQVRRECAVALNGQKSNKAVELWVALANQHDGKDRWYLEALGIAARGNWDACLESFMKANKKPMTDAAVKDIVWRSRARRTPSLLADILLSGKVSEAESPRFMRAFDFFKNVPEAEKALERLLELE